MIDERDIYGKMIAAYGRFSITGDIIYFRYRDRRDFAPWLYDPLDGGWQTRMGIPITDEKLITVLKLVALRDLGVIIDD